MKYVMLNGPSRKEIAVRGLYTLLLTIMFEALEIIIHLTVMFQYVHLFTTQSYCVPLRTFSNKLTTYMYKLLRYITLNENTLPFPFSDFPEEMETPEIDVTFK